MFRFIALVAILLGLGWLAVALKARSLSLAATGSLLRDACSGIISSVSGIKSISSKDFGQKLVLPVILISVLLLALTGFVPPVFFGLHLSGYLLMIHVVLGPLFFFFLVLAAILWAQENMFAGQDWAEVKNIVKGKEATHVRKVFYKKILFWIIVVISLPAASSIFLSMYKIFGTHGQEVLLNVHRYSTLILFLSTLFYAYLVKFARQEN